jgi:hypothetical protein
MKLSKVTYAKFPSNGDWCLILETQEDLKQYIAVDNRNNVDSALALWNRLAEYRSNNMMMDAYHASQGELGIARLMAFHLENPKGDKRETTIVDYCTQVDSILYNKYLRMSEMIDSGVSVRTNWKGGFSGFDNYFISLEDRECNADTLLVYLTTGEVEKVELKFNKKVLILENDEVCSPYTYSVTRKYEYDTTQIVNRFRVRMLNKTKEEIYKLFNDAINDKLKIIFIETTLNDKAQFDGIKSIIEKVMTNNPNKHLTIYLNITTSEKLEIKTVDNIKLIITNNLFERK